MMSGATTLLIELGTEELPVKALPGLARSFVDELHAALTRRGIDFDSDGSRALYGPRRLAATIPAVATEQPTQHSERRGPAVAAGLDAEGRPTRALLGFAASCDVAVERLEKLETDKGAWFVHRQTRPGASTAELLPDILREAVAAMPIPRPMRWGDHEFAFVRPLLWLTILLGDRVVEAELFGVRANRMSRGHRFHHPKPVWIGSAEDYVETLRQARVLADPDQRRETIRAEVEAAARLAGGVARIDAGVLDEVNCLVEWPKATLCGFDEVFLEVPSEALIATMETNQKFFPVLDDTGLLSARFVGVANIESSDPEQVQIGYERVIRPRFADARFFYDEDRKQGLVAMNEGLKTVAYQHKLGTLANKVARVVELIEAIAVDTGIDPTLARRAASLAKADLQSRLVGEFPELQGIAGRYYALAAGEPREIALAIDESYRPRYSGDAIAETALGRALAVAERLDTLAGGFAAGLKPSGNKDPFALRRAALGLARTLIEGGLDLNLREHLARAVSLADLAVRRNSLERIATTSEATGETEPPQDNAASQAEHNDAVSELHEFILDRLRGYYLERGIPGAHFEAVAASVPASLPDFDRRLRALTEFARLPEAEALAAANKRIGNILRKTDLEIPEKIARSRLLEEAEIALAESVEAAIRETDGPLAERDYVAVLTRLAWLRQPVDAFFDSVMVMAEDPALRENRLALLKRLSDRFQAVADIARLSESG